MGEFVKWREFHQVADTGNDELYSGPIYYWLPRGISHAVALLSPKTTQHLPRNAVQQGLDPQEYHVGASVGCQEVGVDLKGVLPVDQSGDR